MEQIQTTDALVPSEPRIGDVLLFTVYAIIFSGLYGTLDFIWVSQPVIEAVGTFPANPYSSVVRVLREFVLISVGMMWISNTLSLASITDSEWRPILKRFRTYV